MQTGVILTQTCDAASVLFSDLMHFRQQMELWQVYSSFSTNEEMVDKNINSILRW